MASWYHMLLCLKTVFYCIDMTQLLKCNTFWLDVIECSIAINLQLKMTIELNSISIIPHFFLLFRSRHDEKKLVSLHCHNLILQECWWHYLSFKRKLLEKLVPKRVLIIIKLNFTWNEVYHISVSTQNFRTNNDVRIIRCRYERHSCCFSLVRTKFKIEFPNRILKTCGTSLPFPLTHRDMAQHRATKKGRYLNQNDNSCRGNAECGIF